MCEYLKLLATFLVPWKIDDENGTSYRIYDVVNGTYKNMIKNDLFKTLYDTKIDKEKYEWLIFNLWKNINWNFIENKMFHICLHWICKQHTMYVLYYKETKQWIFINTSAGIADHKNWSIYAIVDNFKDPTYNLILFKMINKFENVIVENLYFIFLYFIHFNNEDLIKQINY